MPPVQNSANSLKYLYIAINRRAKVRAKFLLQEWGGATYYNMGILKLRGNFNTLNG